METTVEEDSGHPTVCLMSPAGEIAGRIVLSPPPEAAPRYLRLTFQGSDVGGEILLRGVRRRFDSCSASWLRTVSSARCGRRP